MLDEMTRPVRARGEPFHGYWWSLAILLLILNGMLVNAYAISNRDDLQVKKCELAGAASVFVYEPASEVTTEDSAEVVVRHL